MREKLDILGDTFISLRRTLKGRWWVGYVVEGEFLQTKDCFTPDEALDIVLDQCGFPDKQGTTDSD